MCIVLTGINCLHSQLLDQEAEMSHWEETIFGTAQTASYAAITRPQLANETLSISKLPVRDAAWVGRHMPEPSIWGEETLGFDEATCLANLIIVQPSKQFFRDRDDAAYFRSWVSFLRYHLVVAIFCAFSLSCTIYTGTQRRGYATEQKYPYTSERPQSCPSTTT